MGGCYLPWGNTKCYRNGIRVLWFNLPFDGFASSARSLPPVNHYKVLGVTPKSTQAEIKASFYKLSKLFHPDVSDQSEETAKKFRQITAAYEILGNLKLRKMYDKGLLPHDGSVNPGVNIDVEYEEPTVRSPYKKTRSQPATGKTNIYDFDQWSRLHYGTTMNRRSTAKEKWESQEAEQRKEMAHQQSDNLVGWALIAVMLLAGLHFVGASDLDIPNTNVNKKKP